MPGKNDYVNYSTQGICRIEDIRFMKFSWDENQREYYVLKPVHEENAHIFVSADNRKQVEKMRPILSKEEIDRMILSVRDQGMEWISDHRERTARFQEILAGRDERELLLLAGSLYLKASEGGRGLSSGDMQVLRKAEKIIRQEFAFSLGLEEQDIGPYIREKMGLIV